MVRIDRDQWGEIMDSLTRNKARTFLTAFGIFWGVFMLLFMLGGGNGLQQALSSTFAGFASNSGFVGAQQTSEPYKGFQEGRKWDLTLEDCERVKRSVSEVDQCLPSVNNYGTFTFKDKKKQGHIKGVYPGYDQIESNKITEGRNLNETDNLSARKVCVIGSRVKEELFNDSISPVGQFVQVDGIQYLVVGVDDKSSQSISINGRPAESIQIPFATFQKIYNRQDVIDILCYTVKPGHTVSEVDDKVLAVIQRAHYLSPTDKQACFMLNLESIYKVMDNLFHGINILIWMVGIGTLLAGIIGVSNIMLVTVKERTTEIGILRAIGATPQDILVKIMSESIVLTLLAGMAGISFSVGVLALVGMSAGEEFAGVDFQITFGLAIGAALVISFLGVLAGLAPTYRAMHIKPVDAMREE